MNQSKLEVNTCSRREARENVRERVMIGFRFTSDWLKKWREFFKPITERNTAKPKQMRISFYTQVKTALMAYYHLLIFFFSSRSDVPHCLWNSCSLLIVVCLSVRLLIFPRKLVFTLWAVCHSSRVLEMTSKQTPLYSLVSDPRQWIVF